MKTLGILLVVCLVVLIVWISARRGATTGHNRSVAKKDYRIEAADLDDAKLAWAVIEPIWRLSTGSNSVERLPDDWDGMTVGQLNVYAVTWVEREVNNGGFWQYLYNSSADLPAKALEGFRAMGAADYAELLEQAISAFPGGVLPPSRDARMRLLPEDPYAEDLSDRHKAILAKLDELNSKFFELYGDGQQYYKHVSDYVRSHPDEFFRQ